MWRESDHLFFKLGEFEAHAARNTSPGRSLQEAVRAKLDEWFEAGLQDWDISRDAPYFGFEIPDAPGKYFYVWFDAPIGYIASFEAWRADARRLVRRVLEIRDEPPSCITSSARTSATSTRCSGRRCCMAPATAARRRYSRTAS